jgi:hypothetical protein
VFGKRTKNYEIVRIFLNMPALKKTETVLITGGSSGIGFALAKEFASRGYKLILVSNQKEQLHIAAEKLQNKYSTETHTLFLNLALPEAAAELFNWCQTNQLQVDVLVNNAGVFFFGEVVKNDIKKIETILSLHVNTPAMLCRLFGEEMKQRRSGNIIIISSLAAYMPYPGIAFYAATKRFLKSFACSLRTEMIDYNVNVTCVCPGAVSTDLYDLSAAGHKKALKMGIMMRPEKLARKIVRAMNRHTSILIPGFINRVFLPFLFIIPHGLITLVRRYSKLLPPDQS